MDEFLNTKIKDLVQDEDSVFNNFDINHLFGKEKLEDIQEKISKATGLAFVTVDFKGEPVTEMTSFTDFCREIRRNEGEKRHSDYRPGALSRRLYRGADPVQRRPSERMQARNRDAPRGGL